MNKLQKGLLAASVAVTASVPAFAAGPSAGDLAGLTPDTATILTAVGAIGVVLITVNLAIKGFNIVRSMIGKR